MRLLLVFDRNGIMAVATNLDPHHVDVIDGKGHIVMPGFVDVRERFSFAYRPARTGGADEIRRAKQALRTF